MEQTLRRICGIAALAICLLTYLAWPAFAASEAMDDGMEAGLVSTAESLSEAIVELSQEEIDSYKESGDAFTASVMEAWENNRDELGQFKSLGESVVEEVSGGYSVTLQAQFANHDAEMVYLFDGSGIPTSFSMNVQYPMSVLLGRAGMNTLMGLGIVFAMLVFLTFVISLFRFISKIEGKSQPETGTMPEPELVQTVQIQQQPVISQQDDQELIAVIAAAIAAYEGTSADGFVVRSIRKASRKKSRW